MVSTINKITLTKGRPTRIVLKHGCQTPGVHRCLFTKNNQQKHKDLIKEKKIKGVHKVIDLKHLKKQYNTPDLKQKLMEEFDMFMAQKQIISDLYKVLGKEVYKKRREPIPIDIYKPDLQKEILRTAKSTYMNFHTGSCYAVKIATTMQSYQIAFENFMSAYQKIIEATPGGEENIRSFQIKTANSTSLPIYDVKEDYIEKIIEEEE
ncbi:ribosomal protein L1/ribosomal biogenesis protein [Cokeromyces recurvatus]|uniref:ribosomal protein L1/ribosomal biogenesis protein n=1 Tax=Cokeromyces recurvatus TaxID=90255 RepID=UPI00221EEDB5|nr:ribosomal protein L1/ribosomal biogenesis protein [Cokeromyces recurvatus]KAI7905297.1 ribosomal protein L1/ribosomal biogenesis protein [Cokeromyces recurvatus]